MSFIFKISISNFIEYDPFTENNELPAWILNLVFDENPDKLEISYWNLLPILVKSLQELSAKNQQLKQRINNINS